MTSTAYHSLTLRDVEILRRLANGETWDAMAKNMHIANSALRHRMPRIRQELGANSNIQAVYFAAKRGII